MMNLKLISLDDNDYGEIIFVWEKGKWGCQKDFREYVYSKIDNILCVFKKTALTVELNDMQCEVLSAEAKKRDGCFESKFTIPLYFVNLILQKHNLRLVEEE